MPFISAKSFVIFHFPFSCNKFIMKVLQIFFKIGFKSSNSMMFLCFALLRLKMSKPKIINRYDSIKKMSDSLHTATSACKRLMSLRQTTNIV